MAVKQLGGNKAPDSAQYVCLTDGAGNLLAAGGGSGGSGTVTSVSVVTANGISGTVSSPTIAPAITLNLGAITPTSVKGLNITTTTGTLTLANAKTFTVNNTLTFSGTDGTTFTFPSIDGTVATLAASQTLSNKILMGVTDGSSAPAGAVGEYVIGTGTVVGSPISLIANAISADVSAITLTAGDWNVWAAIGWSGDAATLVKYASGYFASTSGSSLPNGIAPGREHSFVYGSAGNNLFTQCNPTAVIGPVRVSLTSNTTWYLTSVANFTSGAMNVFGNIYARRVR